MSAEPRRYTIYSYFFPADFLDDENVKHGDTIALIPEAQAGYREYVVVVKNNKKSVKLIYDGETGMEFPVEDEGAFWPLYKKREPLFS